MSESQDNGDYYWLWKKTFCHKFHYLKGIYSFRYPENILPLRLIDLLDSDEHWRKKSLSGDSSATGKQMYAKVHQSSVLYQNLYQYLIYKWVLYATR